MPSYHKYTEEEIQFLREYYPTHSFADTHMAFCEKFGEYTESQVKHRLKKNHITTSNDGKFKKGLVAWNKGLKIKTERPELYEKYKKINHDKFVEAGVKKTMERAKPIGTESDNHGHIIVKVSAKRWRSKARIMYEKYHKVKLKPSEKVLHLNGDYKDFSEDNLMIVDNSILARLNQFGMISKDKDITRVTVTKEKLLQKIRELEKEKK